jgi:hypothetical protein
MQPFGQLSSLLSVNDEFIDGFSQRFGQISFSVKANDKLSLFFLQINFSLIVYVITTHKNVSKMQRQKGRRQIRFEFVLISCFT